MGGGQQALRVYYYLDVMVSCGVSIYLGNSLELASLLLNYFPRHKFLSKMPETMKPVCLWHLGDDSEPDWCTPPREVRMQCERTSRCVC